ncbi:MAG: polysaccharide biosynthesis tyrosine autokinase [Bacteroidales bacterium]|nr:polysaccharide biosynthesis tyrosine autokinase [Bacteroidales bacterium]
MDAPNYLLEEEEGIDLRKWFYRIVDNWVLFVMCLVLSVLFAVVYNIMAVKEYELATRVLIKENTNPLDKANLVNVSLYSDPYRLENEIGIINSTSVIKQTLLDLDFFVEYYRKRIPGTEEIYSNSPFVVNFDSIHPQPVNVEFVLEYLADSIIMVSAKGEQATLYNFKKNQFEGVIGSFTVSDTIKLGDTLKNMYMKFTVESNLTVNDDNYRNRAYSFYFRSLPFLVQKFRSINVEIPKSSSIMKVSMKHTDAVKAARYLNSLMQNYLSKGIERENLIAQRTIDFIDSQLLTLVDSLQYSEKKLEDFRSEHKLVDIDYQAQQAYTRQNELDRQKSELTVQKKYLEYLEKSLKANSLNVNELIAPSTLGISDAVLNNLILELVGLYNERTELTLNTRKNNPYITSIDTRIESLKAKLSETVSNIYDATNISLNELDVQVSDVSARLSKLPKSQRELLNFQRKFQLNDELYTYLLTRRSEMQIKKASNLPSNEILEFADAGEALLVHPNKKMNLLIALLFGAIFPFAIIYLRISLNFKVQSPDDIKLITKSPIVGTIFENDNLELPVVVSAPNSIVAESFRILRANMQFVTGAQKTPVFVVSSAMKGEGKSYTAINFAAVYASYNKKVCLVDLDLRRPRLAEYLALETNTGMSNYLIGQAVVDDIITPVCNKLFDFIASGPIPPNPSELAASERLEELVAELKKRYDVIVLDSPPIGMVSDAMFISKIAGYMLLVVRHNVTHKQLLSYLFEDMERNQVKKISIVYNDVPASKKGYYRYGSRYGYYYNKEQKSFLGRLMG